MVKGKLAKLLLEGNGHTIWSVKDVVNALRESEIDFKQFDDRIVIKKNRKKSWFLIELNEEERGVSDLSLIGAIVDICFQRYDGNHFIERGSLFSI